MPTAAARRRSSGIRHALHDQWPRAGRGFAREVIAGTNRYIGAVLIIRRDTQRGPRPLTAGAATRWSGPAPPHG